MKAAAFCPAHITGFFQVHSNSTDAESGTTGAGLSIRHGVTTTAEAGGSRSGITTGGYDADGTDVSEYVMGRFQEISGAKGRVSMHHQIDVPVGYGLGSSGAVALSAAYALDGALGTGLGSGQIGRIAHEAEVACSTGLGDVLAAYHGGFEMRTKPGAPGVGEVRTMPADGMRVVIACMGPISTKDFIRGRISQINGLGGRMVKILSESGDCARFQEMSMEFARHVGMVDDQMQEAAGALAERGLGCGVALFGRTVFSMVPDEMEDEAAAILGGHSDVVIRTGIDRTGAKMLSGAGAA